MKKLSQAACRMLLAGRRKPSGGQRRLAEQLVSEGLMSKDGQYVSPTAAGRATVTVLVPCPCGADGPALTRKEIAAWNKLRGFRIMICPCGHEVPPPRTAHDVRKMSRTFYGDWAHTACAKARAPFCAEFVRQSGSVLGHKCFRKATTRNNDGRPVCTWHKLGPMVRTRR